MYYSVSETGLLLGVCSTTIRRWDKNGLMYIINPTVALSWNETLNVCGDDVRSLDAFLKVMRNHKIRAANDGDNLNEA